VEATFLIPTTTTSSQCALSTLSGAVTSWINSLSGTLHQCSTMRGLTETQHPGSLGLLRLTSDRRGDYHAKCLPRLQEFAFVLSTPIKTKSPTSSSHYDGCLTKPDGKSTTPRTPITLQFMNPLRKMKPVLKNGSSSSTRKSDQSTTSRKISSSFQS